MLKGRGPVFKSENKISIILSPIKIPYITRQKLLPTNIVVINFDGFDVKNFKTLAIIPFLFFSISKKTLLHEIKAISNYDNSIFYIHLKSVIFIFPNRSSKKEHKNRNDEEAKE